MLIMTKGMKFIYTYLIVVSSVFVLPYDVLGRCAFCKNLTEFARGYLPWLDRLQSKPEIGDVAVFFVSYATVIAIVYFVIYVCFIFWDFDDVVAVLRDSKYSPTQFMRSHLFFYIVMYLAGLYLAGWFSITYHFSGKFLDYKLMHGNTILYDSINSKFDIWLEIGVKGLLAMLYVLCCLVSGTLDLGILIIKKIKNIFRQGVENE